VVKFIRGHFERGRSERGRFERGHYERVAITNEWPLRTSGHYERGRFERGHFERGQIYPWPFRTWPFRTLPFNECSDQSNWSMPSSDNILPSLRTTIHLSSETWSKIEPINTLYKNRLYRVLNKGWTDVIAEELWKTLKLPCCFAFKDAKINDNPGEIFLKIWGKCTECGTIINAYASNKPVANGINIHVSTIDTTGVKHVKKTTIAWC